MLTNREIINMLKRSLSMVEDRSKTQKACNLKDDEFYPFMVGYLPEDIRFIISHLENQK